MKNKLTRTLRLVFVVCLTLFARPNTLMAQCVNADFSDGNFTGWAGTYFATCTDTVFGDCLCSATNPYYRAGFNQGPDNSAVNDDSVEYNQVITTTAGGVDPNLAMLGATLPVVWPGGSGYAARSGTMWQAIESGAIGQGESMSYTFVVTPGNCNFTYHYAVVLNDGGHIEGQQAYFSIKMTDGSNNEITCAGYNTDATSCHAMPGFISLNDPAHGPVYYKPWSSVLVPLENYIGQTVTITFTTRSCLPDGCAGSHYGYSYFSCECAAYTPLSLVITPGNRCGSPGPAITAPSGFGSYAWTGPGVLGPGNTQTIHINQPGRYSVSMGTASITPCIYALDTVIPDTLNFLVANFSASTGCLDSTVAFSDLSGLHDSITSWAWDFNNDGITDATTENPSYVFHSTGTYPVKLTITSSTCTTDTVINITMVKQPGVTLTAPGAPVCAGVYDTILYTVSDSITSGLIFNWDFDSANLTYALGDSAYQLAWYTPGTKTVTLTVVDSNCASLPVSAQVIMKPYPQLGLPWDTGVCLGSSITLTASGATSYAWKADSTLSDTTTATVIATPDTTTTYSVTGTLNGCSVTYLVEVDVISRSNILPIAGITDSICVNDTLLLGYPGNSAYNDLFTWSLDGGYGSPDTPNINAQFVTWPNAGTKTVIANENDNGCVLPDTTIVYVLPAPVLTLIGDTTGCLGNQITLNVQGAPVYVWTVGSVLYHTDSITISPDSTITKVFVTGTNNNGCSTTDSLTVTANSRAVVSFATSGPVCVGDTLTVTFTGHAVANATFNWNFGYGNADTLVGPGPISVSWDSVGFSPASLTVSQYGCISTFADTVPVQICSGIKPVNGAQINIFPNPAKNDFTIEVSGAIINGQLVIYDVLGQPLYAEEINTTSGYSKQIHLDVASGVYFVSVREGDKYYTQKLVIE